MHGCAAQEMVFGMLRRRHAPGEAAPRSANVVSSLCAQSRRAPMHGRPPAPGAWVPPSKTQGPPAQAFSADAGFESQISNPRATQEHRRWRRALWLRSRGRGCSVRLLRPPSRRADALGRPSVRVFDPDGAITVKIVQPARMLPKRPTSGPLMHARAVGFQPLLVHSGVKRWALQDRTFRHLLREGRKWTPTRVGRHPLGDEGNVSVNTSLGAQPWS